MLVNRTKGLILTEKTEVARNFFSRGVGLMFRRSYDGALIFPNVGRAQFHGFFCFFPILLVCLDEQNRVRKVQTLKPWSVVDVDCKTVIELDARKDWQIDIGDELVWNENKA